MNEEEMNRKSQKNLYLTQLAQGLLEEMAARKGVNESALVEMMLRDEAARLQIAPRLPRPKTQNN